MGSKPITARAAAKVYANSVAKKFRDDGIDYEQRAVDAMKNTEDLKPSGTPEAVKDVQVSQTGGYGDVFYPKSPFYGGGFDTGITQPEREKVKTVSDNLLVQGAADLGASTLSKPVELDLKTDTGSVPGSITSGEVKTSDDGRFVGPYERRQRQRAVRKSARDRKRGMIKEARLTGGDVSEARRQAKLAKARDIKAEAERMAGSNVDAYKTKFRGSGPKAPEIKTVKKNNVTFSSEKAANSSAGLTGQLAKSMKPVNMNTKPANAKTAEKLTDQDKIELARGGVGNKNATTPLFKMGGYGSKTYKN